MNPFFTTPPRSWASSLFKCRTKKCVPGSWNRHTGIFLLDNLSFKRALQRCNENVRRPPDVAMCGKTTYAESFLKNDDTCMEKPIRPVGTNILPYGGEFAAKTIYKESFLESAIERVEPFLPCNSISKPDGVISGDTTNKVRVILILI